jgi:predicted Zn-dependent peptidase
MKQRTHWGWLAAAGAAALLSSTFVARPAAAGPHDDGDPEISFERYQLDNGLEVILHRDNSVPLVAVNLWYHVGSGDETPGKSGFAHLFEHMLFQGAKHIGEDVHFDVLQNIGGSSVNGSTTTDRTNYFEVVPSHELEVALWLESDRMGYLLPLLNDKSLANQIDVVRNERRQRIDNVPYGTAAFELAAALYPEGHPYRYLVIGRHEDLSSSTLDDVKGFYRKWYVPANATLVLAGDFEPAQAKQLVAKWFGTFPKTTEPQHQAPPLPALAETVRKIVPDDFAKLRRVQYTWLSPPVFGEGDAELNLLAHALGATGTGRLYKILVHERQLAQSVSVGQGGRAHSGEFTISVMLKSAADLATVEQIVNEEVARAMSSPLTEQELKRAVVQREAAFVWGLEPLMARAETLQRYNHYVGQPDYITQDLDRFRKTTPAKVQEMAQRYLGKPRVEIVSMPAEQGGK